MRQKGMNKNDRDAMVKKKLEMLKKRGPAKSKHIRISIPDEAGGGLQTIPLMQDSTVSNLKKKILNRLFTKGLIQSKWIFQGDLREMDFSLADKNDNILSEDTTIGNQTALKLLRTTEEDSNKRRLITFNSRDVGMGHIGSYVNCVYPGSQAAQHGVTLGWRILEINGKAQPENDNQAIVMALERAKKKGKFMTIRFLVEKKSLDNLNNLNNNISQLMDLVSGYSVSRSENNDNIFTEMVWNWNQSSRGIWSNTMEEKESKKEFMRKKKMLVSKNSEAIDKALNLQDGERGNNNNSPSRTKKIGMKTLFNKRPSFTDKMQQMSKIKNASINQQISGKIKMIRRRNSADIKPKKNLGERKRKLSAEIFSSISLPGSRSVSRSRPKKGAKQDVKEIMARLRKKKTRKQSFESKDGTNISEAIGRTIMNKKSTTDDLLQWLCEEDLEEYKELFANEEFDGSSFILLNDLILDEMKINKEAQNKLLSEIQDTKARPHKSKISLKDRPDEHVELFLDPGSIGIGYDGNRIVEVVPNSQAANAGIYPGCYLDSVNGEKQPNDTDKIFNKLQERENTSRRFRLVFRKPQMPVVISTNIGYNCDSFIALCVALKDHLMGRVRIQYISTCSPNTVKRAKLVQWLCGLFGVVDIPIIPCKGNLSIADEKSPDNVVELWKYYLCSDGKGGEIYRTNDDIKVEDWFLPDQLLCKIVDVESGSKKKVDILNKSKNLLMLFIGPDPDIEVLHQISDPKKSIHNVVWLGNEEDISGDGSFNMTSGMKLYNERKEWFISKEIMPYYIGTPTGNSTRISRKHFCKLQNRVPNLDLRLLLQLGVKEFRDNNPQLFYKINPPPVKKEFIRNLDSECTEWFDVLEELTPLPALSAYLLLRDSYGIEHSLYAIKQEHSHYLVGITGHDIKYRDPDGNVLPEYMSIITDEIGTAIKRMKSGKNPAIQDELTKEVENKTVSSISKAAKNYQSDNDGISSQQLPSAHHNRPPPRVKSSTPQLPPPRKSNHQNSEIGCVSVSKWLTRIGLEQYINNFEEEKYDNLDLIRQFSAEEMVEMVTKTKMKKGSAAKFKFYLQTKK